MFKTFEITNTNGRVWTMRIKAYLDPKFQAERRLSDRCAGEEIAKMEEKPEGYIHFEG